MCNLILVKQNTFEWYFAHNAIMLNYSSYTSKKEILIFDQKHFKPLNSTIFNHPVSSPPKVGQINLILIWQAPIVFFQKWCLFFFFFFFLLSIVVIELQVGVLRLMKMHDYLNVPTCIINTPCIIWFMNGYGGIFRLWAFRKYKLLCVSNVHNKEYAPLKQNICIFLYILVWNIFSDLYVTCGLLPIDQSNDL